MADNICKKFENLISSLKKNKAAFDVLLIAEQAKGIKGYNRPVLTVARDNIRAQIYEIGELVKSDEAEKEYLLGYLTRVRNDINNMISENDSLVKNKRNGTRLNELLRRTDGLWLEVEEKWPIDKTDVLRKQYHQKINDIQHQANKIHAKQVKLKR